jgi:tRNA pseudouridine38-40 synthase
LQKYFFHIAYKGTNYRGWQRQLNLTSVQEVIETTLSSILKTPITIVGCGRTDAQVHASQFFFHLEAEKEWDFDLLYRVNKLLPPDIAVYEIIPVSENQHARFDAIQRTYDYFIHTSKNPFLTESSSLYEEKELDIEAMKAATAIFVRQKDFRAFCKRPDKYKHTICNITSAQLFSSENGEKFRFQISADRFLSSMVRMLMSTLLQIGKSRLSLGELENCFATHSHPEFITPAYPQGLYLSKVTYRYLDIPARTDFSPAFQKAETDWILI